MFHDPISFAGLLVIVQDDKSCCAVELESMCMKSFVSVSRRSRSSLVGQAGTVKGVFGFKCFKRFLVPHKLLFFLGELCNWLIAGVILCTV